MSNGGAETQAQCSHIPSCELFARFGLTASLKVWQVFYCNGNFASCARYQSAIAGRPPPPNLLPNGKTLDLKILGL